MNRKKILFLLVPVTIVVLVLVILLPRLTHDDFSRLRSKGDLNFILITVDTLRADRIGCYGFDQVETPTMDMFAAKGVKFEQCIAQTPLTLPSHTSIMTGTPPTFHGVRDNGGFLVSPQLITLAEIFKQQDYSTSAFVASYVLDSKWGLDQGFDFYFDQFDLSKYQTISLGNVQRRGDEVIDQALGWLNQNGKKRFFTWIHLYDPHTPYEAPPPFSDRYPDRPYLGEIAYTDSQLARLWAYLEDNNLVDNTVLIFASDHGESLGEHQESTHGFFIYQAGIHVPLIVVTPVEAFQGKSRKSVVSLTDIMPTMMEMAGMELVSQIQGRSLVPLITEDREFEDSVAYAETFYPRFHYGWSELQSVQQGRYKLIIAPQLELYDVEADPNELNNLTSSQPQETRQLMDLANRFIEESSRDALEMDYRHMDEETRQKLTALGYIGAFTDASSLQGRRLGDPKDKIVVFNQLSQAKEWGLQGKFDEGISLIDQIIAEDPDVIDAYFSKGNLYFKSGRFEKALQSFFQVLDKKPDDAFTGINIANSYVSMGKFDEAEAFLTDFVKIIPSDSQISFILGNINFAQKDYEEAEKHYRECMKLNPSSASAYNALGGIFVITERLDEAEKYLTLARERNEKLSNLRYNFAQLFEARGDMAAAERDYLAELVNVPHSFRASFNLSRLYRLQGRVAEEMKYLEQTIESNPRFPLSYFYKARLFLNQGINFDEAVDLVHKGIELKPEDNDLRLGYYILADLYNRLGDAAKSADYARKGHALGDKTNEN